MSLENIRKTIDEIDGEMRLLFEKRMDCIKRVSEYKFNNNEKIFDENREEIIIQKNVDQLKKSEYKQIYEVFLQDLMDSSKSYQKKWIQDKKEGLK